MPSSPKTHPNTIIMLYNNTTVLSHKKHTRVANADENASMRYSGSTHSRTLGGDRGSLKNQCGDFSIFVNCNQPFTLPLKSTTAALTGQGCLRVSASCRRR